MQSSPVIGGVLDFKRFFSLGSTNPVVRPIHRWHRGLDPTSQKQVALIAAVLFVLIIILAVVTLPSCPYDRCPP